MNRNTWKKGILPYLFLVLLIFGVYYLFGILNQKVNVFTYQELTEVLEKGTVTEMEITPKSRASVYEISGKLKDYKENEYFFIRVPLTDSVVRDILEAGKDNTFIDCWFWIFLLNKTNEWC